ncbi:MAG: GTPase [Candidatus Binatota bacterium]|nr:GTPase [Candidatus Binatota bacterium]
MVSDAPTAASELPRVAVVGRTNAGKSTLFNRIVGRRRAIVGDAAGVTRDRMHAEAEWLGHRFRLTDTGGFEADPAAGLGGRVREQSLRAIADADVILYVVDGRAGVTPADEESARLLAAAGKPVVLAVNKIDSGKQENTVYDFYRLGLGEPLPVSAEHGLGFGELLDRVIEDLPETGAEVRAPAIRLALLGRPNVGKSSLLNRLLGEDRVVVDSTPGTTRDAIDAALSVDGRTYVLVDTAGIRRRSRVERGLERASIGRALDAVERAEVALLVIDAAEGITDQDARLASLAWERGRGLLLVANKWDLLPREERDAKKFVARVAERHAHFTHVPAVAVSALRGTRVSDILPAATRIAERHATRISTRELNDVLGRATAAVEPPIVNGKRARFYYATSVGTRPPTVTIFVNDPTHAPVTYLRYLENRIREAVPLEGTPLRIRLRERPRRPERDGRPRRSAGRRR